MMSSLGSASFTDGASGMDVPRSGRVLVAAELRSLLPEDPLPGFEVVWIPSEEPTPTGEYVAIVPLLSRPMGEEELAGLPSLKVLAQCAVGYDNIDLEAAARRGFP